MLHQRDRGSRSKLGAVRVPLSRKGRSERTDTVGRIPVLSQKLAVLATCFVARVPSRLEISWPALRPDAARIIDRVVPHIGGWIAVGGAFAARIGMGVVNQSPKLIVETLCDRMFRARFAVPEKSVISTVEPIRIAGFDVRAPTLRAPWRALRALRWRFRRPTRC